MSNLEYRIKSGDTLAAIARHYNVTVESLVRANRIANPNRIWAGQVLWIPRGSGSSTAQPSTPIVQTQSRSTAGSTVSYQGDGKKGTYDGSKPAPGTTKAAGVPVDAPIQGDPKQRNAATYDAVIDQFAVGVNPRYTPKPKTTYCNIFLWDVTRAMGSEIPHWVDGQGNPSKPSTKNKELTANATFEWLRKHGGRFGWRCLGSASKPEASAPASKWPALWQEAQNLANRGFPVIGIWSNPGGIGHVGVVRPGQASANGPALAQAGAKNFNHGHVHEGFGNRPVEYWVNDSGTAVASAGGGSPEKPLPTPTPSQVPTLKDVADGKGVLRRDMSGPSVKELQQLLVKAGYLSQKQMNTGPGVFGPATEGAVKDFQRDNRLAPPGGQKGAVDRVTLEALIKAKPRSQQDGSSTSSPTPTGPVGSGGFKALSLEDFLSHAKGTSSLAAIIIGNAEGTRTPSGGKTGAFYGHTDPGNSKSNKGSFSYQVGSASSPEDADRKQLAAMREKQLVYTQAAKKAGLDPANALLASAYFDSYNQSPSAASRFLGQFSYIQQQGLQVQSVTQARIRSWIDPQTGKRYVVDGKSVGGGFVNIAKNNATKKNPYRGEPDVLKVIENDQTRRVNMMVAAMQKQGLTGASGSAGTQPQPTTPNKPSTPNKPTTPNTPSTPNTPTTPEQGSVKTALPNTSGLSAAQRYDLYAGYFKARQVVLDTRPEERTILGLRVRSNTGWNKNKGKYDDRVVLLWLDTKGQKHALEFLANTEPSAMYLSKGYGSNVDGKNGKELSQLMEGYYEYAKSTGYSGWLKGKKVLRPVRDVSAQYDVNHDGWFDAKDGTFKGKANDLLFHAGGNNSTGSAGCQTMKPDDFERFWNELGSDRNFMYLLVTVG
jgi:peptidoglycan hydrolase-like protein with peptidoglycan-binding domain